MIDSHVYTQRIDMKSYGTMEGVYINGAPQGITFHETDNYALPCFDNQHQQESLHKALLHWLQTYRQPYRYRIV